jgi:hypothetical protein
VRRYLTAIFGAFLLLAIAGVVLVANWPFTRAKLITNLQEHSGRRVAIQQYKLTFFPPGCVAEKVSFLRHDHPDKPPVISLERLVVRATWLHLLTFQHKVPAVDVYGMHVLIPPRGAAADGKKHSVVTLNTGTSGTPISIETLSVHGASLDFMPGQNGKGSYHLDLRDLKLYGIKRNQAFRYTAVLENTVPPGEIHANGSFGPWSPDEPGSTPVDGTFDYNHVQLNKLPGISGILDAHGKFSGTLDRLETDGELAVPGFRVTQSANTESLKSTFQATVNATDGDTFLKSVRVMIGRTTVDARGSVTSQPNHGGVLTLLNASVANGRMEDLIRIFIKSKESPLIGSASLRTSIRVHSGPSRFLERLEMSGDFESSGDSYRSVATQGAINRLTEGAQGENSKGQDTDARTVPSDLKGHVAVRNGVAHIANLILRAPETEARMDGEFNLITEDVNLAGTLRTDGNLSDTQQGFKAFALKMITPFLKKRRTTVVPFEIKGKYGNVSTRLDLDGKRKL